MRKTKFANGEYYHIFSRGIDKRITFLNAENVYRFLQSMDEFNTVDPIGSIYENSFKDSLGGFASKSRNQDKLVDFVCFCINPNHYHFVLRQLMDDGIRKFMHRLGTGYTMFFNKKYDRTGALFHGPFKSVHINSNEYLLHVSAYVNLNNRVHQLGGEASKLSKSSWDEYIEKSHNDFCSKEIILGQFRNLSEYKEFAENSLKDIRERKDMEKLLLE